MSDLNDEAIDAGNLTPLLDRAIGLHETSAQLMSAIRRARTANVERALREDRRATQVANLSEQAERDATELEELRFQLGTLRRLYDESGQVAREQAAALDQANREIQRLRRVNQQAAERAFLLQPGLRVRIGQFEGEIQEAPVMVPVLLDGAHQVGRFDSKFVHYVPPAGAWGNGAQRAAASVTVDGVSIGTAKNIRLTSLEPDGTPIPYTLTGQPAPADAERPPFHHQPGSAPDYLEALAEEVTNGPRELLTLHTLADREELTVRLRFNVPSKRGELSDLLYVAHPANRAGS